MKVESEMVEERETLKTGRSVKSRESDNFCTLLDPTYNKLEPCCIYSTRTVETNVVQPPSRRADGTTLDMHHGNGQEYNALLYLLQALIS